MKKIIILILISIFVSCSNDPKMVTGTIEREYSVRGLFDNSISYYFTIVGRDENNKQVYISVEVPDSDYMKYDYYSVYTYTKPETKTNK